MVSTETKPEQKINSVHQEEEKIADEKIRIPWK